MGFGSWHWLALAQSCERRLGSVWCGGGCLLVWIRAENQARTTQEGSEIRLCAKRQCLGGEFPKHSSGLSRNAAVDRLCDILCLVWIVIWGLELQLLFRQCHGTSWICSSVRC